ncbi:hypothetical protein BGW80DRAFT_395092 [Lactifluus volemus]|nr:hypothetical protein BGW80DRAFT_395092 [Lactifluus volemus]
MADFASRYSRSGGQLWPEWTEDQCLFVRGFRVTRFLGILPPRLRGAAEPVWPPDRDDDAKFDKQLISIPPETNYQDPLHTLLDYLAKALDNLQPDAVMGNLENSRPKIWSVECERFPASEGRPEVEIPVARRY